MKSTLIALMASFAMDPFSTILHHPSSVSTTFVEAANNGLGLTPPMGWNSWNRFGCDDLNESLVLQIADALHQHKLDAAGYKYINLDDCWQTSRTQDGTIQADADKFPSGIRHLADQMHQRGLLFGLYSDAGYMTCARRPGSVGYEVQDAATYANWTVDYLKYDNCYSNPLTLRSRYTAMHDALNATGRPIFFSMCEWGWQDPATWASDLGNSWRTTGDIKPTWDSWTKILDKNDAWYDRAGPGGWNDPDMLEVGNGEMENNLVESRSHFTLWCLIKAPLLLGNDLRNLSDDVLKIITNPEVIAWNQDKAGHQGHKVATYKSNSAIGTISTPAVVTSLNRRQLRQASHMAADHREKHEDDVIGVSSSEGPLQVWAGNLTDHNIALVLFNRSPVRANITAHWEDLGLAATTKMNVRCVWWHKELGSWSGSFTTDVESHGVAAFQLLPVGALQNMGN